MGEPVVTSRHVIFLLSWCEVNSELQTEIKRKTSYQPDHAVAFKKVKPNKLYWLEENLALPSLKI